MSPNTWWLSFCDPQRPEGSQCLGVAIITEAGGFVDAVDRAHRLGANPGGEVQGEVFEDFEEPPRGWPLNRLITPDEFQGLQATRDCPLGRNA